MGLRFVGGRFFQLGDGPDAIFPTASEIQNVVFENGQAIRNHPVSAEDFLRTGIEFVEYLADPLVIVEYRATEGHPTISCRFVARSGIFEANVARADSTLLDYGIVSNRWLALPSGATAEALDLLATLRLSDFGQISLGQYMKLGRLNWSGIMLDDRTGEAFPAASIAPLLLGQVPAGFVGRLYP